jgi:4-amino-4-deoxy-L-arabinose transferase-like glycosyltransferase
MHSQPAVDFKRKGSTVAITGFLTLVFAAAAFASLQSHSRPRTFVSAVSGAAAVLLAGRTVFLYTKPYLHLTDRHVTIRRGIIPNPKKIMLIDVHSAHTNQPETYIELIGKNESDAIRIDLHPLDKADRIRFIFLVESSINRKFSHQHSSTF